jgi:hypothetical protein
MAIVFSEESNGNIRIEETGKPTFYIMGHVYAVMTANDAGTHIILRDGDFNFKFDYTQITAIGNTSGPYTLASAMTALSGIFKK